MRFHLLTSLAVCSISLAFSSPIVSQRPPKILTPQQITLQQQARDTTAKRLALQAEGQQVFNAEMAREAAGDCKAADSTYEFNLCYSQQESITSQNLSRFERVIRDLILNGQQDAPAYDSTGIAGPSLTPQHLLDELHRVETLWQQYSSTACTAAFHQFDGGTGGPSFEGQCNLALTRSHMRELNLIYGGYLRL